MKSYSLLCCVLISGCFDMTSSLSVSANISWINQRDDGLPNDIMLSIGVGSNSTKEFHLARVDHISINVPVYSISRDPTGEMVLINENVPNTQKVAFYQDTEKQAVIQITADIRIDNKSTNYIITRGAYIEGDLYYSITPAVRAKRDTLESHLDQQYDLNTIKSPDMASFDYILPDPKETLTSITIQKESLLNGPTPSSRRKRQSQTIIYIHVTAIVDFNCYNRFLIQASNNSAVAMTKIQEYYAFIFSGVDLIYQGFNANNLRLYVKLTKVVIFDSSSYFQLSYITGDSTKVDTVAVLKSLKNYLTTSTGSALVFPYNHAMMFVDADLWSDSSDIVGLAYVGSLCSTTGSSSSVIEDRGLYDYLTSAHELGHSLSANHDGNANNCSSTSRYLMTVSRSSPTNGTELNPWKFSPCTNEYFVTFITELLHNTSGQTCLTSPLNVTGYFPDVSNRLLGQEIPEDKQCQIKYGVLSHDCMVNKYPKCTFIYCLDPPLLNLCYPQIPLPGTSCGCGKVCKQGECVTDVHSPVCNIWTNCTSAVCSNAAINGNCAKTCNFTSWLSASHWVSTSSSQTPTFTIDSSVITWPFTTMSAGSSQSFTFDSTANLELKTTIMTLWPSTMVSVESSSSLAFDSTANLELTTTIVTIWPSTMVSAEYSSGLAFDSTANLEVNTTLGKVSPSPRVNTGTSQVLTNQSTNTLELTTTSMSIRASTTFRAGSILEMPFKSTATLELTTSTVTIVTTTNNTSSEQVLDATVTTSPSTMAVEGSSSGLTSQSTTKVGQTSTGCEYEDRNSLMCSSISSCQGQSYVCCKTCVISSGSRYDLFLFTFALVTTVVYLLK